MSINSIEKIKQAQSSLKSQRKPVSHVQEATKQAQEITQFVKTALNKDNRWIFQTGEQESIVLMLNNINKTSKELYEKCRTPEHFNRDIGRYLKMKKDILRKSNCIHLSLDQGFYYTEPLGFSPRIAVELSSKKLRLILEGLSHDKWILSPIETTANESATKEVEKLFSKSVPLAEKIFKNDNYVHESLPEMISQLEEKMNRAAEELDFEEAAKLRDQVNKLRKKLIGKI